MALSWTSHPVLKTPTREEQLAMGADKLLKFWERREEAMEMEADDPFRYGYEPDYWTRADDTLSSHEEILLMGGNRSGKSEWAAKKVVECLVNNPSTIIWCLTETSANSIQFQQKMIYKYLPKEYKHLGRGKVGYVVYSLRNGFTSAKFSLPNKSEAIFRNWSQDLSTVEGGEIGCPEEPVEGTHNIGFWADELIPLSWLETLRFRTVTRAAKGICTYTAVDGWNATTRSLLTGARTVESAPASLLGGEEVPVVMQPLRKASSIVFFHTEDNPWGGWKSMKTQLEGEKRDVILCRGYGLPTKAAKTVFPKFTSRNVVKDSEVPVLKEGAEARWFTVIDPAGSKPWFMLLVGIDPHGVHWVVKEFPDASMGEWVDLTKGDKGTAGEAQKPNGYGIEDYAREIRALEGGRDVERLIDPRLGAASFQKSEGASNIIDELTYGADLEVYPAEGLDVEVGVQAINSLLSWDEDEEMGYGNMPRLMVSDACQNFIVGMNEWVNDGNSKHPSKDPCDCIRYLAVGNYQYHDEKEMTQTPTGGY